MSSTCASPFIPSNAFLGVEGEKNMMIKIAKKEERKDEHRKTEIEKTEAIAYFQRYITLKIY